MTASIPHTTGASPFEPLAYRIPDAQRVSGFSRSEIYRRAGRGEITLLKSGATTLVDAASLHAAVAALPRATVRGPKATVTAF